jgi:hypothetical protein
MTEILARNALYVPRHRTAREPRGRPATAIDEADDQLSRGNVERRVLRACKTIRALPDRDRKNLYHSMDCGMWSQAVTEWTAYGADTARVRFQPTGRDIDDCLVALAWCRALDCPPEVEFGRSRRMARPEFQLVWCRSRGWGFQQIGDSIGRPRKTVERWYDAVLDKLHKEARSAIAKKAAAARWG